MTTTATPAPSPLLAPTAAGAQPVFLVVVADRADADFLPAAAARARGAGARLLIALARPRPGFTTDPAIARHAAIYAEEDLLRLQQTAQRLLHGSGVHHEILRMTYWDSLSLRRRQRRIAAATHRLARRHHAVPLPFRLAPTAAPAAEESSSTTPPRLRRALSARPVHVVAVLPDSAEAVSVARAAGRLALATGRPLALVVPVPGPGFTLDPTELAHGLARIGEDTAAVAGRVRPTLERLGLSARVFSAPYRTDVTSRSLRRGIAAAVEDVTTRLRAEAVVLPAGLPALADLRIPNATLHRVEPDAQEHTPQEEFHPSQTASV